LSGLALAAILIVEDEAQVRVLAAPPELALLQCGK